MMPTGISRFCVKNRAVTINGTKNYGKEFKQMLPGRALINEIEEILDDIDADEWEFSTQLEDYILERAEYFVSEWEEIKRDYADKGARERLRLMLDTIQSEAFSEREELAARVDCFDKIDTELENLIQWDEEDI